MFYKIKKHIALDLLSWCSNIQKCNECNLPKNYEPQFGLIGKDYDHGGIIFMQINPGVTSALSNQEIDKKYKRENNRNIARQKVKADKQWLELHRRFRDDPTIENLNLLNSETRNCIETWGWPLGKYIDVLRKHGSDIDDSALLNIAQCPFPDNKYSSISLKRCFEKNTIRLLEILHPGLIVTQGKPTHKLLMDLGINYNVVEGVHHAFRGSNSIREKLYSNVNNEIQKIKKH